jgi:hypothetical protein
MNALLAWLDRRSLLFKLVAGFSAVLAVVVVLGIDSLRTQRLMQAEIERMYEKELLGVSAIRAAQFHYASIGRTIRQSILAIDLAQRENALAAVDRRRVPARQGARDCPEAHLTAPRT